MDFEQVKVILSQYWYVLVIFVLIGVGSIFAGKMNSNSMKKMNAEFLRQNPDAAKVYLTNKSFVTSEAVTVHTVNFAAPNHFVEGRKTGFYLKPGKNNVEISYTYTRPGVMYKSVTKSTDVVTKELEAEAKKSYILAFDRKEKCFTFEETTEA